MQMIKIYKVLSLFFKPEDFIFALAMNVLEGFILVLLLGAIGKERKNNKAWLLYNRYPTTPKVARPRKNHIRKKLYCFTKFMHIRVLALSSKVKKCRCCKKSKASAGGLKSKDPRN